MPTRSSIQAAQKNEPGNLQRLITNQFHFIFGLKPQKEPFHLAHYLCLESCLQVNRPDRIYLYLHHEPFGKYWDLIKGKITPVFVEPVPFVSHFRYSNKFTNQFRYAHHSDFIRLEKLLEKGGIYADMDTIFVNPIPEHLYSRLFVLGREGDVLSESNGKLRQSLCNAFVMSTTGADFGKKWLQQMTSAFDGKWSNHSCLLAQELSEQYPELIHIEPARTFYKHLWTKEGIYTLLQGCDTDFDGVVSMHLWSHLWWSKNRRDFSDFHAGQLTEDYVRTVDTTYNIVARKFLPSIQRQVPVLFESEKNSKVSVIIPTFNRPDYLEKSVGSALSQTLPAQEIIIVNDGSEERFLSQIERIAAISNRIRVYNLPVNRGRSYCRNFGLDKASGDYVVFLDDDDLLDPEMIRTSQPYLQGNNVDVVTSLCKVLYPPAFLKRLPLVSCLFDCTDEELDTSQKKLLETVPFSCIWRWCPPIHACMVRKSSLGQIRFPEDLTRGEDWYVWLSLAFQNRRFKCNPEAYAYVRRHETNTIASPGWFSGKLTKFLEKIVEQRMVQRRDDLVLLNLRLFLCRAGANSPESLKNLPILLRSPSLLFQYGYPHIRKKIKSGWRMPRVRRVLKHI